VADSAVSASNLTLEEATGWKPVGRVRLEA